MEQTETRTDGRQGEGSSGHRHGESGQAAGMWMDLAVQVGCDGTMTVMTSEYAGTHRGRQCELSVK
jgi:hypothetical protein